MLSVNNMLVGLVVAVLSALIGIVSGLNIVIPGGTGNVGKVLIPKLADHDVTVLSRNAFLASAPNRVTGEFGFLGQKFLENNKHSKIRDWDGGDLLDIVGQDWVGWQEDTLKKADVVVNLVGGYTEQRIMAAERIVRESLQINPSALQVVVSPMESELQFLSPGMLKLKSDRINACESLVLNNCVNAANLRLEANALDSMTDVIVRAIKSETS
jgi:hypothetical protein